MRQNKRREQKSDSTKLDFALGRQWVLVMVMITFKKLRERELAPVKVETLADAGALHLVSPRLEALQCKPTKTDRREVRLADGSRNIAITNTQ